MLPVIGPQVFPSIGRLTFEKLLLCSWVGQGVFFGAYHFARSSRFNTVPVVVFLTVIGLVTSLFFFVS